MGMCGYVRPVSPTALAALRKDPSGIEELVESDARQVSLEKMWHAIHFLLSGDAEEVRGTAGLAVLGGDEIGEDLGYGPARVLAPDAVARVAEALAPIDRAWVDAHFDAEALADAGIYPEVWDEDRAELVDEIWSYLGPLCTAYAEARSSGRGMVLWLM